MRYWTSINNRKCKEWELNCNQGALFDLLNQLSSWATPVLIGDATFYFISRNKIITEIPMFYSKPDTVYRHLKILEDKKLIQYLKKEGKDLILLTNKGKTWNSEIDPSRFGNESENDSELYPTYKNTKEDNNIKINKKSNRKDTIEKYISSIKENNTIKESLKEWLFYKKKLTTEKQFEFQRKRLIKTSNPKASVDFSIGNGYAGLFEEKPNNSSSSNTNDQTTSPYKLNDIHKKVHAKLTEYLGRKPIEPIATKNIVELYAFLTSYKNHPNFRPDEVDYMPSVLEVMIEYLESKESMPANMRHESIVAVGGLFSEWLRVNKSTYYTNDNIVNLMSMNNAKIEIIDDDDIPFD